jgi:DUF971 family protein
MTESMTLRQEKRRDGVVVWDQRGLVVVWPDGYSGSFSWEMLRHISACTECQGQGGREVKNESGLRHIP